MKNGYTENTIDVWGIVDGREQVVLSNVRARNPILLIIFPELSISCHPIQVTV